MEGTNFFPIFKEKRKVLFSAYVPNSVSQMRGSSWIYQYWENAPFSGTTGEHRLLQNFRPSGFSFLNWKTNCFQQSLEFVNLGNHLKCKPNDSSLASGQFPHWNCMLKITLSDYFNFHCSMGTPNSQLCSLMVCFCVLWCELPWSQDLILRLNSLGSLWHLTKKPSNF